MLKYGQNESHALITNQEMAYKTLQRQVKELERLNGDNQSLRQMLETERQTVLCKKYLMSINIFMIPTGLVKGLPQNVCQKP